MSSLSEAARSNNRREALVALRDKLAASIDACESGRDIAALSRQFTSVLDELDAMPDPRAEPSPVEAMRARVRDGRR